MAEGHLRLRQGDGAIATLSITVIDQARVWIDDQVAGGRESVSALMEALIQREIIREKKIAKMQRLIEEGLTSGIDPRSREEILADIKRRARRCAAR